MNQRFLVNKAIALLSFGQTPVVVSFRFNVYTIFFVFLRWLESQFEMYNNNNNIFISYIKYTNITPPANSKANRGRWCVDGLRFITNSWSEKVPNFHRATKVASALYAHMRTPLKASLMMRICALIEIEFFFLCDDLKVLEVIHNLWSIIDGIIVKNFLECILVLLREDGDDQPLILQTKLILKETLMIVHVQH